MFEAGGANGDAAALTGCRGARFGLSGLSLGPLGALGLLGTVAPPETFLGAFGFIGWVAAPKTEAPKGLAATPPAGGGGNAESGVGFGVLAGRFPSRPASGLGGAHSASSGSSSFFSGGVSPSSFLAVTKGGGFNSSRSFSSCSFPLSRQMPLSLSKYIVLSVPSLALVATVSPSLFLLNSRPSIL